MYDVISKKNIDFKDTIKPMLSDNYKERFKAEYWQFRIRIEKLTKMLDKYENNQLDFKLKSPPCFLYGQLTNMINYKQSLEQRAIIENICLGE